MVGERGLLVGVIITTAGYLRESMLVMVFGVVIAILVMYTESSRPNTQRVKQ